MNCRFASSPAFLFILECRDRRSRYFNRFPHNLVVISPTPGHLCTEVVRVPVLVPSLVLNQDQVRFHPSHDCGFPQLRYLLSILFTVVVHDIIN